MAVSPRGKNRRICGFCASYSPLQFSLALLCDTSKNYKETIFAQGNGIPWRKNRPAPDVHAVGCDESAKELPPSRALLRGFDSMQDAGTRPAFAFGKGTDRLELYKGRTAREKTQRRRHKTCLPWRHERGAAVRMIAEGHCGDACVYKYACLPRRCLPGKGGDDSKRGERMFVQPFSAPHKCAEGRVLLGSREAICLCSVMWKGYTTLDRSHCRFARMIGFVAQTGNGFFLRGRYLRRIDG